MRWSDVVAQAPEIAEPFAARVAALRIGSLGTVRADGSPRVSPVDVSIQGDGLYLSLMPGSAKLADVRRDPRYAFTTSIADHRSPDEFKLFGEVAFVSDRAAAEAIIAAHAEAGGFDPATIAGSPVVELLIGTIAWQHAVSGGWQTDSWQTGQPVRHRRRAGLIGDVVELDAGSDRRGHDDDRDVR